MDNSFREFPCDLCGSSDAVEVPYARLYTKNQPVHICKECGFVYVKLRRSSHEIAAAWSEHLYGTTYTAKIPAIKARQIYVADFTDTCFGLKGKTVLDIGAGEGQFLSIAKNLYGAKVFGIEPSAANCQTLRSEQINCFQGTIEEYLSSGQVQSGQVATILWTLENCASCRDMLGGAYQLLNPDGVVVVATGSRLLVPFKKPLFMYFGENPADTHCFRFSANTLRGVLAISGFKTLHINRYLDTDYLCIIAQKRPKEEKIPWQGDDFLRVHNFFERWHHDSMFYVNGK